MKNYYDIIIIGAGASGLTAGIVAKRDNPNLSVLILEKKLKPGIKLSMTGKGKCNIANTHCDGLEETITFLSSVGIQTIEKDEGRLYPEGKNATEVVKILESHATKLGCEIVTNKAALSLDKTCGQSFIIGFENNKLVSANKVLIATGGKSYPKCGTTGDGYVMARKLGHKVETLIPGLTGVETKEDTTVLHGIRAKGTVKLYKNDECIFEEAGEVQFSRGVISGIVVMNMSLYYRNDDADYVMELDLEDGSKLGKVNYKLHPTGLRGWKEAQITCGGVSLNEVDHKTMESLIVSGLYFAGEVLDYQGPCGGYNLNNAWRTGIRAGHGLAKHDL